MKKKKFSSQDTNRPAAASPAPAPASSSTTTPKAAKTPKGSIQIDYPLEGEILTSGCYTFRLGASPTDRVEVSIDGKDWLPCRECVGYWWFDWSGYGSGAHSLEARIPSGKRYLKSKLRQFTVLI
ncbi:MAG TPA: hypothetical protein P5079_05225 [Elusimicrobiota bacterium]|nr:hypothetical protein [Elusimicrobiota bacterium]